MKYISKFKKSPITITRQPQLNKGLLSCMPVNESPQQFREGRLLQSQLLSKLGGLVTLLLILGNPPSVKTGHSSLRFPNKYCSWLEGCHFVFLINQVFLGQWFSTCRSQPLWGHRLDIYTTIPNNSQIRVMK